MYSHQDFMQSPKKYELFRTAVVAKSIITHNGENDLNEGQTVSVEFRGIVRNQLFKRNEPIYLLNTGHCVYANVLRNFCL